MKKYYVIGAVLIVAAAIYFFFFWKKDQSGRFVVPFISHQPPQMVAHSAEMLADIKLSRGDTQDSSTRNGNNFDLLRGTQM